MATQFMMDEFKDVRNVRDQLLTHQNKKWLIDSRSYSNLSDSIHINIVGVKDTRIVVCYDVACDGDFEGVYVLKNDEMVDIPVLSINTTTNGCSTGLHYVPTLASFLDKIVDTLTQK